MSYNARNDEIHDNTVRMQREWEAQRHALATVRRFNARLSAKAYSWFWPKISAALTSKHTALRRIGLQDFGKTEENRTRQFMDTRLAVAVGILLAMSSGSVAQQCNYDLQENQLIMALNQRAYAEASDKDFAAACETMRDVLEIYNRRIESFFRSCGDLTTAVNTQTTARSAAALARTYCKNAQ